MKAVQPVNASNEFPHLQITLGLHSTSGRQRKGRGGRSFSLAYIDYIDRVVSMSNN